MPIFETDSIVLRSYNLSEADRIVVLYTHDHGLIRAVAKGARRLRSKFGSSLEPFCEARIEYFQKDDRELVSLQNADLIQSSFAAASQPELLTTFSHFADLLVAFAPPHDPNKVLYRMIRACILVRPNGPGEHEAIKLYFETWIMRLGGYLPDWSNCGICKRRFSQAETAQLLSGYRLACGTCMHGHSAESVSAPERETLQAILQTAPEEFVQSADLTSIRNVRSVVARIVTASSGRDVAPLSQSVANSQRTK